VDATGLRVAVITSSFNASITEGLNRGAVAWLTESRADVSEIRSPGAFELPLLAQKCASVGFDAVVCLGAVVEGDTDHYEHVAHRASEGLMRVQLDTGVPVAFGILTVREAHHAVERSRDDESNKGREAAIAAVSAAVTLRTLG
jgi:6,7-dimethyl-8-ribityllumazine synthase